MGYQYVKNYVVNTVDFDKNRHLRAITIVDFLQDISTSHYNWAMAQKGIVDEDALWVIVEWDIEILSYPQKTQTLSVMTEPTHFRKFIGNRRYEIKDENGDLIVRAYSKWAYISQSKRLQTTIPPRVYEAFEVDERREKPKRLLKVPRPEVSPFIGGHKVAYSDIDVNGHVNNGAYFKWLMDAIPSQIEAAHYPNNIQIHYRCEMFENEEASLQVYASKCEDTLELKGEDYLVAEIKRDDQVAVTCVLSWS